MSQIKWRKNRSTNQYKTKNNKTNLKKHLKIVYNRFLTFFSNLRHIRDIVWVCCQCGAKAYVLVCQSQSDAFVHLLFCFFFAWCHVNAISVRNRALPVYFTTSVEFEACLNPFLQLAGCTGCFFLPFDEEARPYCSLHEWGKKQVVTLVQSSRSVAFGRFCWYAETYLFS